ncbi:MAG: ribonuclease P protein component [Gammaproteobacteria bacterium]|jgi:ribonuclease P protein component|nr:ribonuclease P protein component [Gammaproteobacteria bacterium]MBT4494594.1 ribonuclease P protein component [Gammaproteobacteria bacterium]MBT7370742.1 ribonuclease P protein component [Gammaproteobacteria bacterium]
MPDYSFPTSRRLCSSEEFDTVFQDREYVVRHACFLFLAKINEQGFNRLGLVIAKKNVHLAVDRNRIKRKVREAFRQMPVIGDGVDIVVLARPGVRTEKQVSRTIDNLFQDLVRKVSES